jgi:hypothetical protein
MWNEGRPDSLLLASIRLAEKDTFVALVYCFPF